MSVENDGGPAFPCALHEATSSCSPAGMSLRDYFAAAALQGLISNPDRRECLSNTPSKEIPKLESDMAYKFADAMIAERSKKP